MAHRAAGVIGRRDLLLGGATAGIAACAEAGACAAAGVGAGVGAGAQAGAGAGMVPEGGQLAFRIMRRGDSIGTHVLSFTRRDNGLDIGIKVDIAVGFGPLVLFRYTLRGLEQWRNGAVVHVEATTDDDGKPEEMQADRDGQGLWVQGSRAPRYLAPPDALPATHWNMAELDGPWINPQDGRLFHPAVQRVGFARVPLADGREVTASDFRLSGDVHMELWYDAARQWTALLFAAKDESVIRYEKT